MYIVDFGRFLINDEKFNSIEDAKRFAEQNMDIQGDDVSIKDDNGIVVAKSLWLGATPNGHTVYSGFYTNWM